MTPAFKIIAAGIDITGKIANRLLSLVIVDEAGFKSDTLEIIIDDRGQQIALPPDGAPIAVAIGYEETAILPMGVFTVTEIDADGPPDKITIRANAVNLGGSIKEQKTRDWDNKTIEEIVTLIASEHDLEAKIAEALKPFKYEHLDQTDESDIHFLTRIAKDHDALASVKGQTLLFMGRGEGRTVSGLPLLPFPISKTGKMKWKYSRGARQRFGSVEAVWHNQATGQKESVVAGERKPAKKLRHVHSTKAEAESAAKAKLDELGRGLDTLRVDMPGEPILAAEGQILATGFRLEVAGLWSITRVRHAIGSRGFTTSIETEKPKSAL
jgi:phage protein D